MKASRVAQLSQHRHVDESDVDDKNKWPLPWQRAASSRAPSQIVSLDWA